MNKFELILIIFVVVVSNMISFLTGKMSSFVPVTIKTDVLYPLPQINTIPETNMDSLLEDYLHPPHELFDELPMGDQYDISDEEFDSSLPFTERQYEILKIAKRIGEPDNYSLTLMGIALQESLAGELDKVGHKSAPFGKRSYGVMQVKLQAAQDVFKKFPELKENMKTDEEIIGRLIYDDEFNIKISLGYIKVLKARGMSWREILLSYNVGPTAAKGFDPHTYKYVKAVINHIKGDKIEFMTRDS